MANVVETPEGPVEFPDSMSDEQIKAVLRKKYGSPTAPKSAPATPAPATASASPGAPKGTTAGRGTSSNVGAPGSSMLRSSLEALTPEMQWEDLWGVNVPTPKLPKASAALPAVVGGAGLIPALTRIGSAGLGGAIDAPKGQGEAGALKSMIGPALIEAGGSILKPLSFLPGLRGLRGPAGTKTVTEYSQSPWASGNAPTPPATVPSKILAPSGQPAIPNMPNPAAASGPAATTTTTTTAVPGKVPSLPPQLRQILDYVLGSM